MPDELLVVVSSWGVSEDGAQCLQVCLDWFVQRRIWRFDEPGGRPLRVTFVHDTGLDQDVAARVDCRVGKATARLSPEHFDVCSLGGLRRTAAGTTDWSWFPTQARVVRRAS
ncbi:hypothetical protein ACPPVT_07710 [Angustibacter sp. McL0619]|uniref:hypothetical protein n=1 Tax=Angustibacter sp. McL0619 TaxID=3415676 RepID=UPI003CF0DFC6